MCCWGKARGVRKKETAGFPEQVKRKKSGRSWYTTFSEASSAESPLTQCRDIDLYNGKVTITKNEFLLKASRGWKKIIQDTFKAIGPWKGVRKGGPRGGRWRKPRGGKYQNPCRGAPFPVKRGKIQGREGRPTARQPALAFDHTKKKKKKLEYRKAR